MVGLAFYRYVPKVEPIASASPETVCSIFGPTLQRYLTGPLNLPPSGKAGYARLLDGSPPRSGRLGSFARPPQGEQGESLMGERRPWERTAA